PTRRSSDLETRLRRLLSSTRVPAPARVSAACSALGELLDVLLGERLQAGDETLHFALGRVIGKDQLLRSRAVRDVCHPVVEVRRATPRDGDSAESHTAS